MHLFDVVLLILVFLDRAQMLPFNHGVWDKSFLLRCLNLQRGAQQLDVNIDAQPKYVKTFAGIQQFYDFSFDSQEPKMHCRSWFGDSEVYTHEFQSL
jgi:hypothetical protein